MDPPFWRDYTTTVKDAIRRTDTPCYEDGGATQLAPGALYSPPWTIKPGSSVREKPSAEVRKGFTAVKALIKRQLVRLKVRPDIWSGREASRLVEEGKARINGFESSSRPA